MMRQKMKELIWNHFCPEYAEIQNKIKEYSVISFDMFDTLVTRNVMYPTDIFSYVELLYQKSNGNIPFNFKEKRIEAEKSIREKISREVTLAEIYAELASITGRNCDAFLELEKECEILFMEPRKDIKDIYEECIRLNKRIYILSDMYLDKEVITMLLHKCGYSGWTGLYVSSDTGVTKRTGGLYRLFLTRENLFPHTVLHIGDSIKSDYIKSRRYHFASLLLENKRESIFFDCKNSLDLEKREWLDYKSLQAFCSNRLRKKKEYPYVLGYCVLGPVLFAFSKWLNEIVQEQKPDCLVFMAREGMMLKKAYEQMFPRESVPLNYLRTSRRSVAYPELLEAGALSDISDILPVKRNEDLNGLLELLRLNTEDIRMQLYGLGYSQQTPLADVSQEVFEILKDAMREKALQQKDYLQRYLEQNNLHGNVLTVDIGWRGTTQHFLNKFCDKNMSEKNIRIKGCYVGVLADNKQQSFSKDCKYGYWFDETCNSDMGNMVAISRAACELLFMPSEGSVTHYAEENGEIVPHFDPIERSDADTCKIQTVQNAALDFVREFGSSGIKDTVHLTPKITLANYFRFGIKPNKDSLRFVNAFHFTECGAVYSYKANRFWTYLARPRKFIKDLSDTAWKTGFMRECFGLDLPYYKLLVRLRKSDQTKSPHKAKIQD